MIEPLTIIAVADKRMTSVEFGPPAVHDRTRIAQLIVDKSLPFFIRQATIVPTPGFSFGTIIGLFFAFVDIFFVSIVDVANKVLANNRVPIHTQVFYVALNTIGYSLIYLLFTQQWYICAGYAVLIFFQSCLFYIGNYFFNAGLKYIDLAKSAPLAYSRVAFVLILGFILIGENIYFSDIIGTCLILVYMFYNLYSPIIPEKKKKEVK